ncbi:diguanylate cyclase [Paraburkholderia sediminicola]|uniref:diguanylate cyclase n=1 Tax=Paraburkholderia TaxID=1822464 RepID=UPI0038B6F62A
MDLFESLHTQMRVVRLPLYAVTLTAVARVNTPLLTILHWHGRRRATPLHLPGVEIPPRPVPGSAIQISEPWQNFETVERALLDAAWQLGAWDVERVERRPCNEIGASAGEALACRQAFGDYAGAQVEQGLQRNADEERARQHLIDDAPDRDDLMRLAAREGYLRWLFRPVKGGVWRQMDDSDDTRELDGGRRLPCPVMPQPRRAGQRGRTLYRLGSVRRIIVD